MKRGISFALIFICAVSGCRQSPGAAVRNYYEYRWEDPRLRGSDFDQLFERTKVLDDGRRVAIQGIGLYIDVTGFLCGLVAEHKQLHKTSSPDLPAEEGFHRIIDRKLGSYSVKASDDISLYFYHISFEYNPSQGKFRNVRLRYTKFYRMN